MLICTHNRSDLLMRTIASLNEVLVPDNCSISLLVIANACTDETITRLKNYQYADDKNKLALHFGEELEPGKSYALNHALNIIKGGYICFIDDDHRIEKNYFSSVSASIKQYPKASIWCGQIIPDWTGEEPQWIHEQGTYKIYPLPIPHFELGSKPINVSQETNLPGGGNLIVQQTVFTTVGSFSTELGPKGHNLSGSEDSDFILRALDAGMVIQYVPEIIQYHYVDLERLQLPYLILKSFQRTRSFTLAHHPARAPVPLYLWRKLFNYKLAILIAFNIIKIRFYLMRFASTLGEITGLIENRKI